MRRECAALALFSLRRKQARPVREPDAIFDKQPSVISYQPSVPLVALRSSPFAPVHGSQTSQPAQPEYCTAKSLFHRSLRVTCTASIFCGGFSCKALILKNRGEGEGGTCQAGRPAAGRPRFTSERVLFRGGLSSHARPKLLSLRTGRCYHPANPCFSTCAARPRLSRKGGGMKKLSLSKIVCMAFMFWAAMAIASPAQTFTTLFSFDQTNGANPQSSLIQGTDGNFYGTTNHGGANCGSGPESGCGTFFKITPEGTLTTLYSFCARPSCTDGAYPSGALVQAIDRNFYGTTYSGGYPNECVPYGCGTVFKITPSGTLTTLYSFCSGIGCPDGFYPSAGLVQASDGNFYGTTLENGAEGCYQIVARSSKSPQAVHSPRCTPFAPKQITALTARALRGAGASH